MRKWLSSAHDGEIELKPMKTMEEILKPGDVEKGEELNEEEEEKDEL